jgi:hypothetical protein
MTTAFAPLSSEAIFDELGFTPADDAAVVHLTGAESIVGVKTFTDSIVIEKPDLRQDALPGVSLLNTTPATDLLPNQYSPAALFQGAAYDSDVSNPKFASIGLRTDSGNQAFISIRHGDSVENLSEKFYLSDLGEFYASSISTDDLNIASLNLGFGVSVQRMDNNAIQVLAENSLTETWIKFGGGTDEHAGIKRVDTELHFKLADDSAFADVRLNIVQAGEWNGTAIADPYITSAAVWNAKASTAYVDAAIATRQPLHQNLTDIAALADPNADRLLFWDDSAGAYVHLSVGAGLSITGTTLDTAGGSGANTALSNLAAVAINTDLLPASTQKLGSATFPFLESYIGNTTQYERVQQTAGIITHAALGSATNISIALTPKGTGAIVVSNGNISIPTANSATSGRIMATQGGADHAGIQFGDSANSHEVLVFRQSSIPHGVYVSASGTAIPRTALTNGSATFANRFGVDMATRIRVTDAVQNAVIVVQTIDHDNITNTPAAGYGTGLGFLGRTSTASQADMAEIASVWATATHASRSAFLQISVVENAGALAAVAKFDKTAVAGETGLWLWDADNGQLERVTVGAADSGGAGFKVLRIAN